MGLAINEQVLTSIEVEFELALEQFQSPATWMSWIRHDLVRGPHDLFALMCGLPFGQGDDVTHANDVVSLCRVV